nr:ATP-binding protein [Pseudomonadota bacterium]
LQQFINTVEDTCPYPEWPLLRQIAGQWQSIVIEAGGAVGEEVLREPVSNPYEGYSGLPVIGKTFIGRQRVMKQIETRLAASQSMPAIILFGHRRMGKTSILRNLEQSAAPGTLLVYLDMQNAGWVGHTGQLLLDFAEAIHRRAAEAGLDAGPPPAEADYGDINSARRALNALLARLDPQMQDRRLILAVDEFELIEDGIQQGRIDPGVLPYLRSLIQQHRWLALVFGGLHTLDEMGRDYKAAFYGQTEHVRVGYLNHDDAIRLITQPHPDFALEYAPELREEIYRLTYGQPYLLQRLCWELVSRWNERFPDHGEKMPRTLELADLEAVLTADFYASAAYYFDGVWSNITDAEQAVIQAMARREQPWTRAELEAVLSGKVDLAATLKLLRRHDVIVEDAGGVRFAAGLMRRWVVRHMDSERDAGRIETT